MICADVDCGWWWIKSLLAAPYGWLAGSVASVALSLLTTPISVLPYKRYACQTLLDLSRSYLDNDRQSYRRTVRPLNRVIGYLTAQGQPVIDDQRVGHVDHLT